MEKEDKVLELKWIKYLIGKSKEQEKEISLLRKELDDMKEKQEILGRSMLNIYSSREEGRQEKQG